MNIELTSKHTLPGIDVPLSNLALGTAWFSLANVEPCFGLLDEFLRLGGTLIDSARSYGDSEAVLGQWLASRGTREQIVLLTKCAHGDAILPAADYEETVTREMSQSRATLGVDRIDLYLLHRDNPAVPVSRIVERLNREVEAGRARALCASNWSTARVDEANAYAAQHGLHGFRLVSNNLSLAVPRAPFYPRLVSTGAAGEAWHAATGLPLLSWSSQARGFFTGQTEPAMRAALQGQSIEDQDGHTRRMVEVYGAPENLERLARARALGRELGGYSAVQVALAWLLHKPFSLIPVIAPRTVAELHSCVEATAIHLTAGQCAWLNLEAAPGGAGA